MSSLVRSLRFRLTLWYCLVLLATLAGFAVTLYAVLRNQLINHHDPSLIRAGTAVTRILRERKDCESLTADQLARLDDIGGLILIHDIDGQRRVFYQSAESARFPLPSHVTTEPRADADGPWFDTYATTSEMVRVYSEPYTSHAGRRGLVRIMDPLGDVEEPLAALRRILA